MARLFDEELFERLAYDVVKYQNFKTNTILAKLEYPFKNSTLRNYVDCGINYVKRKVKSKIVSKCLYEYIDKALSEFVQPLKPNKYEQRTFYKINYTKKEQTPPVANLEIVNKPTIAKFTYGVKLGDTIKLFDHKAEAELFVNGAKFAGSDVSLVSVELGEV